MSFDLRNVIVLRESNFPLGELRFAPQLSAFKAGRCGGHARPRLVGNNIAHKLRSQLASTRAPAQSTFSPPTF
jgi:hypothetical protein